LGAGGLAIAIPAAAQQPASSIELTVERMVELTLSSSYQVRFLNMSVEQTRQRLRAENARLRSSVSLNVSAPEFQSVSETQYNSTLGRNEIVRENSRRWEAQLSVRQPVILPWIGYPTNGYLSLNNRVYRYTQLEDDGERDITYYNRYFVQYTQPLFQPNGLKNDLERAELDFENEEISFSEDVLEIIDDASGDYYDLFENAYEQVIDQEYVDYLVRAESIAQQLATTTPAKAIELDQIRVELANAREQLQRGQSDFRLQTASLRTRLNLPEATGLTLDPVIELTPVQMDMDRAVQLALDLTPRLRQLGIQRRRNEISLDETEGRGGFRMNVGFTYGREMRDPTFGALWDEPSNTYTIDVSAFVPIWDWGERDARIQASRITVERTDLQLEQAQRQIISNVENEVRNVEERQERAVTMQGTLGLARGTSEQSFDRYEDGSIGVLDLLQTLRRQTDTANNFLDAYLGWRQSLLRLQELTFYDFEYDMPVVDRFGIDVASMSQFDR
jgi:outer membrane protein TolC